MKKIIIFIYLLFTQNSYSKVVILLPVEHKALRKIVRGVKENLTQEEILVESSNGDQNIERILAQKYLNQQVDFILPVGTSTAQMVVTLAKKKLFCKTNIICLACDLSQVKSAGVQDEIIPAKMIKYLKRIKPKLSKMAVLYSSSEKVFNEAQLFFKEAKIQNIKVQKLMVHELFEITQILKGLKDENQILFIFKDHLVVQGIKNIQAIAKNKNVLLVSSDEGTVKDGAPMGIGVKEYDIGKSAAEMIKSKNFGQVKVLSKAYLFQNGKKAQLL